MKKLLIAALLLLPAPALAWPAHGTYTATPPVSFTETFGSKTRSGYGGLSYADMGYAGAGKLSITSEVDGSSNPVHTFCMDGHNTLVPIFGSGSSVTGTGPASFACSGVYGAATPGLNGPYTLVITDGANFTTTGTINVTANASTVTAINASPNADTAGTTTWQLGKVVNVAQGADASALAGGDTVILRNTQFNPQGSLLFRWAPATFTGGVGYVLITSEHTNSGINDANGNPIEGGGGRIGNVTPTTPAPAGLATVRPQWVTFAADPASTTNSNGLSSLTSAFNDQFATPPPNVKKDGHSLAGGEDVENNYFKNVANGIIGTASDSPTNPTHCVTTTIANNIVENQTVDAYHMDGTCWNVHDNFAFGMAPNTSQHPDFMQHVGEGGECKLPGCGVTFTDNGDGTSLMNSSGTPATHNWFAGQYVQTSTGNLLPANTQIMAFGTVCGGVTTTGTGKGGTYCVNQDVSLGSSTVHGYATYPNIGTWLRNFASRSQPTPQLFQATCNLTSGSAVVSGCVPIANYDGSTYTDLVAGGWGGELQMRVGSTHLVGCYINNPATDLTTTSFTGTGCTASATVTETVTAYIDDAQGLFFQAKYAGNKLQNGVIQNTIIQLTAPNCIDPDGYDTADVRFNDCLIDTTANATNNSTNLPQIICGTNSNDGDWSHNVANGVAFPCSGSPTKFPNVTIPYAIGTRLTTQHIYTTNFVAWGATNKTRAAVIAAFTPVLGASFTGHINNGSNQLTIDSGATPAQYTIINGRSTDWPTGTYVTGSCGAGCVTVNNNSAATEAVGTAFTTGLMNVDGTYDGALTPKDSNSQACFNNLASNAYVVFDHTKTCAAQGLTVAQ